LFIDAKHLCFEARVVWARHYAQTALAAGASRRARRVLQQQ
jgi:hypothetical protein